MKSTIENDWGQTDFATAKTKTMPGHCGVNKRWDRREWKTIGQKDPMWAGSSKPVGRYPPPIAGSLFSATCCWILSAATTSAALTRSDGAFFDRTSTQSMKGAFSLLFSSLASCAGTRTTRSVSQLKGKQTETPWDTHP